MKCAGREAAVPLRPVSAGSLRLTRSNDPPGSIKNLKSGGNTRAVDGVRCTARWTHLMTLPSGHYHDHWSWSPGPIAGMPESAVPITSVPIPMVNVRVMMTPIVMVITPMCLCARSHWQKDCRDCNQAQEKLFHNLILSVSVTAGLRPLRREIVVSTARATHVQVAFLQGELCFWLLEAQELSLYWERASRNRDELVATKGKAGLRPRGLR